MERARKGLCEGSVDGGRRWARADVGGEAAGGDGESSAAVALQSAPIPLLGEAAGGDGESSAIGALQSAPIPLLPRRRLGFRGTI